MGRRIHIPGLADVLIVETAQEIDAISVDERLDRRYLAAGPLVNRLLTGRLVTVLSEGGRRLPSAAPREDPARVAAHKALEDRLNALPAPAGDWVIGRLADLVRGIPGARPLGVVAQLAIGRMFVPAYQADEASWRAAKDLDTAARGNPLTYLHLKLSGRLARGRRLLAERVGGDLSGVHATGIAVHTLAAALERMQALWADPVRRAGVTPADAARRCLAPPERVLRQAVSGGDGPAGRLRPGGLAVLELGKAFAAGGAEQLTFMSSAWSRCPAARAVQRLMEAAWSAALADEAKPNPSSGPAPGLRLSWSRDQSARRVRTFRLVLGAILAAQIAVAGLLLAAPQWTAALVSVAASPGWQRLGGALLLGLAVFGVPALIAPLQARFTSLALTIVLAAAGLALAFAGGALLFAGLATLILAVMNGVAYWRALTAELQTRP